MSRKTYRAMITSAPEPCIPTVIYGAPIVSLPDGALEFWLEHYTRPSRMREALLREAGNRGQ